MRRIYESDALRREEYPFVPNERPDDQKGPSVPDSGGAGILDYVLPKAIRSRAIEISVSTPEPTYEVNEPIPIWVELHNGMPFGVSIRTRTPLLWSWEVDGHEEASEIDLHDPPAESQKYEFASGERKRFVKRWPQRIRVSESDWRQVPPGEYTIGAWLNVDDAEKRGLTAETTVEVVDGSGETIDE